MKIATAKVNKGYCGWCKIRIMKGETTGYIGGLHLMHHKCAEACEARRSNRKATRVCKRLSMLTGEKGRVVRGTNST